MDPETSALEQSYPEHNPLEQHPPDVPWVPDERAPANATDQIYPEHVQPERVVERKCPLCGKDY